MRISQQEQEWKSLQERYESLVEAVRQGMGEREPSQCRDCGLWSNYMEEPVECLDCKASLCQLCVLAHQEHHLDLADQVTPAPASAPVPTKEKVVFVGKGGVGKTTTVRRLMGQPFYERYVATLGVEVHPVEQSIIWDTAGQEKFGGLRDGYFVKAKKFFLFFDASVDPQVEKDELLKWFSLIVNSFDRGDGQMPIVLVGCKADALGAERDERMKQWVLVLAKCFEEVDTNNNIFGPIFVSNKTEEGISTLKEQLK